MEIKLDVNSENILSAEETRSLAASIKALQERVEEAEDEVARLREAVRQESARADKAEASLAEVRAAVQQAITDISASD